MTPQPGSPTVRFVLNSYDADVKELLRSGRGRADEIIRVLDNVRQQRA